MASVLHPWTRAGEGQLLGTGALSWFIGDVAPGTLLVFSESPSSSPSQTLNPVSSRGAAGRWALSEESSIRGNGVQDPLFHGMEESEQGQGDWKWRQIHGQAAVF